MKDFFIGKFKAYVLKFAARIAVGQAMKFLERNVRRGIVDMAGDSPVSWNLVTDPSALRHPGGQPARVLLFVHGTFSSTIGAFGALGETPWGQKLLAGARASYDLLLGFDHPTLSEDPTANATELLNGLQGIPWKVPPRIDIVTHSRGALVVRSLIEHLLPISGWRPQIGRVVFVGATNAGTELARTENWQELADLYTNLAVGTCRVLGMIPQAKSVSLVLKELIQGIGAFVKYSATHTVEERAVPGLAAMEPDGDFVVRLNQTQQGQPTLEASDYRAVTSAFKPRLQGDHQPRELPRRFLQWLAGAATTQLMKEANDLVVNTVSMISIDPHAGRFVKDSLDFGENPQVYHTNYFTRPEVANALGRWLAIAEPAPSVTLKPEKGGNLRKRRNPATALSAGATRRRQPTGPISILARGGIARREIPAMVDTDIFVTQDDMPVGELRAAVRRKVPSYVVVRRSEPFGKLNYALGTEEVLAAEGPDDWTVGRTFDLHESDASTTRSLHENLGPMELGARRDTTSRSVVLSGDRPVGVVPEKAELPDAEALAALARAVANPASDADLVQVRRALPTLADPGGPSAAAAPKITCHFHAEMESEVIVRRVTTIEVLVSREVIGRLTGAAAASGTTDVDPDRKILVQVIPKANLELVDEEAGRIEIDPPPPGGPQVLYFDVRPTHTGEGTLWVVARQGQVPLVTLELKPQIVTTRSQPATVRQTVEAVTPEAPRLSMPLHQLFITEHINPAEVSYRYQLQLPTLKILKWGHSRPIHGNRASYVSNLYKEIEDRWISNKDDVENFAEELKAFGASLF
ncbi:MAG TPA: TCAD7 domain-containing protein, partial [Thermoanaerobaculia bacterium]